MVSTDAASTSNGRRNGAQQQQRLSDARRQCLAQQLNVPQVSNFFDIERYYDSAQTVFIELQSLSRQVQSQAEAALTLDDVRTMDPSQLVFDETFNTGLDMCYLWGKRYCTFCVEAIPTHNYYNSPKYQTLKHTHTQQIDKVLRVLERVADQMDVQEQVRRLLREYHEQQEQLRLLERHRQLLLPDSRGCGNHSSSGSSRTVSVQESALEKLKALLPPSAVAKPATPDDDVNNNNDNETATTPNHAVSLDGMTPLLPPTTNTSLQPVPPSTPPSYEAVLSAMQNRNATRPAASADNENTSFHVRPPPETRPTTATTIAQPNVDKVRPPPPPMRQQQEYYKAMYNKYQQLGKIQISPIDTFQGRISESTNGCTVISALIVARHLQEAQPYTVISNATVQNVIDVQCGPILRTIRKKLGLGGHALIIPSDVHDHLVDDKILRQDQFTGAAGGNIMNPQHYREFLQLLADDDDDNNNDNNHSNNTTANGHHQNGSANKTTNGKAGATLFFREHVISIVKSIDPQTKRSYYDLIDSMPGMLHHGKSMATRTRCVDMESLTILLMWYASRKFSDSNCSYIDRNPWNDNMADLDPRVFQGFVWSS